VSSFKLQKRAVKPSPALWREPVLFASPCRIYPVDFSGTRHCPPIAKFASVTSVPHANNRVGVVIKVGDDKAFIQKMFFVSGGNFSHERSHLDFLPLSLTGNLHAKHACFSVRFRYVLWKMILLMEPEA
jgi:hypothetical protein